MPRSKLPIQQATFLLDIDFLLGEWRVWALIGLGVGNAWRTAWRSLKPKWLCMLDCFALQAELRTCAPNARSFNVTICSWLFGPRILIENVKIVTLSHVKEDINNIFL